MRDLEDLCRELVEIRAKRRRIVLARRRRGARIRKALAKWRAEQKAAGRKPDSPRALSLALGLWPSTISNFARKFGHLGRHASVVAEITGISLELLCRPPGKPAARVLNALNMTVARMAKQQLPVFSGGKLPRIYAKTRVGELMKITLPIPWRR